MGAVLQSVTVQASAKVADVASADQTVARTDASFDLIGFVQAVSAAQTASDTTGADGAAGAAAPKPLDPLAALMTIGQLAEKGLKTSQFAEAVAADKGVKIHVFPTPDGATVDTIRDLPMITAADLERAVSLMPASAEKEMVLSLIHDPQTIAAAMKASGLINARQMMFGGQDIQNASSSDVAAPPVGPQGQVVDGDTFVAGADQAFDGSAPVPQHNDPADLAAQQILALQSMLTPQAQPVQPQSLPVGNDPSISIGVAGADTVDAHVAVLPPEITSGPWGQYQAPVMPDERFVRFIMPKTEQGGIGSAASLLGPVMVDHADALAGAGMGDGQSVMAGLAGLGLSFSDLAETETTAAATLSLGDTLASKIAALTQSGGVQSAPSVAGVVASLTDTGETTVVAGGQTESSPAASLFSSIFAKHGIGSSSTQESVTGDVKAGAFSPANGFSAMDFAALGLDPLATGAPLFAAPVGFEQAPPVFTKPTEDASGEGVRSGLLKSLGALKTAQASGGLASQLVNSKQILELAAEEGLTLTTSAQALAEHSVSTPADTSALASFANAGLDMQGQANAHSSSADITANVLSRDAASGGQDQSSGQNHAHQDGQSANQQANTQNNDARMSGIGPASDDMMSGAHAASKTDEAFLSGADAHQTTILSDGTAIDTASFSTASMATSSPVVAPTGGALGAREALMAVTYAMTGRSANGSGSAVAAEMRFMSLGQQVMAALKQNSQEIELRLNPAQLGNVVLKLQVEGQKLSISARTESQLSDDALSAGEEGLRTSLAANGYQLDKFDVSHQDERRKSQRSETDQSNGPEQKSDDPFSFDLIA